MLVDQRVGPREQKNEKNIVCYMNKTPRSTQRGCSGYKGPPKLCQAYICIIVCIYIYIYLIWPPPCNSDHQDYYMFSRGFLLTFTFHCYREGAISNIYIYTEVYTNIYIMTHVLSQKNTCSCCPIPHLPQSGF